jgi:hypothetical protein
MRLLVLAALCSVPLWAQAPPAPAKPKPVVPPARIREFKADKSALQPGQSTTISWVVENPTTTTITGFGNVTAIGNRRITPKATTTYVMTVKGGGNSEDTRSLTITVAGTTAVAAGDVAEAPKPAPRIEGHPDMSGVYNSSSFSQMFGGRVVRGQNDPFTGKLKPGAEKFKVVRGPEDTGLFSDCKPTGVPEALFVPYQWQIVQGKNSIVILYEYPHLFRSIPIGDVQHPDDPDPTWMGNSVAHWEGDTLVVDVVGFNDKTELPGGFRHTESLHVVERFTRVDADNLEYEATIEDPNVFTGPWKISRGFPVRNDIQTVNEFVCENNRDYKPLFEKK